MMNGAKLQAVKLVRRTGLITNIVKTAFAGVVNGCGRKSNNRLGEGLLARSLLRGRNPCRHKVRSSVRQRRS